jgi:hypothetical protein
VESVAPHDQPKSEAGKAPPATPIQPQVHPLPPNEQNTTTCRPDQTPLRKTILEVAAVVIGAGAVVIYGMQLNVMRNQMNYSQRPWVGLDYQVPIITVGKVGDYIRWKAWVKNYGNSPALAVTWHFHLWVATRQPGITWDFPEIQKQIEALSLEEDSSHTIFSSQEVANQGPGNTNEVPIEVPMLTEDLRRDIFSQKMIVILGGRISYRDEFGISHTTTDCLIYMPPGTDADGKPMFEGYVQCPVVGIAN